MPEYVDGSLYYYAPNKVAPIVFAVLFFLSGCLHFYQMYLHRSWKTTGLMPWAALLLTVGFAMREVGAYYYKNVNYLIVNTVFIMSGPPVYAAINYILLSRILYYVPYLSPMHPGRVLTTFIGADAICEVLLVNGAQRMVNTGLSAKEQTTGASLVKAALIMQAVLFVCFIVLAATFHRRAAKQKVLKPKIRTLLTVMYVSCTIITGRCIYRIVEFFQGFEGEVFTHEVYFWIFEASIMFINTAMLNIWHPARYLPSSNKIFLARDGITERRGPGWKDGRPFILTVIDPFDIYGLVTGRDKKSRYWDMSPEELASLEKKQKVEKETSPPTPYFSRHPVMIMLDPLYLYGRGGLICRAIHGLSGRSKQRSGDNHRAEIVNVHANSKA